MFAKDSPGGILEFISGKRTSKGQLYNLTIDLPLHTIQDKIPTKQLLTIGKIINGAPNNPINSLIDALLLNKINANQMILILNPIIGGVGETVFRYY